MVHFALTCHTRLATLASMALSALVLGSCGGGSSAPSTPTPPPPPRLSIATKMLPAGQVGDAYTTTLTASGGTAPYTWSLATGTLPAGLSLNGASGALGGFPSAVVAGVALDFTVTDSGKPAQSSTASLPLTIGPAALNINTNSLSNGQIGVAYSAIVAANGGTTPYAWKLSGGSLPAGLSLNAATGAIAGTPTASVSNATLTFTVTDASNPMQSNGITLSLTIAPLPLSIVTTSLPYGQINVAYSATLTAAGGATPYSWRLLGGTLPAGLSLSAGGTISGTPTMPATQSALTFQAADAFNPAQKAQVVLTLPVSPAGSITVAIPPLVSTTAAALTITQMISVSATTNDNAGVAWTFSPAGGSISPATSPSGANVMVTAPASAGVYTLTATSRTDNTRSASVTVGVTDLAGVFTWHDDVARDGVNAQEYALTTATVSKATFGRLSSCTVDGAVYAQPLWVANATIAGARHNVVFVATAHDALFAFDADANVSPCAPLWQVSLIDASHGGTSDETTVPSLATCRATKTCLVGQGYGDIEPEVGVTSTPVIDPASGTLYLVSKSMNSAGIFQRLHAIDFTTGREKPGSPVTIAATYPGVFDGGGKTFVAFSARQQNQRAGLALVNGTVYVASGAHEDTAPYYGWVVGYAYDGAVFTQSAVFCTTPNAGNGGVWMAGAAPAADSSGRLYLITANGQFDVTNTSGFHNDYGDSYLQLTNGTAVTGTNGTPALNVSSWFTPSDEYIDFINDQDAGSGGAPVVVNLPPGGAHAHLVIGGGKDGTVYLLDGDAMGGSGDAKALQHFSLNGPVIFSTGAFWNNTYYLAAGGSTLQAYPLNPATSQLVTPWTSQSLVPSPVFRFPGATPSISASGTVNGIVWLLDNGSYCTNQSSSCGPAVLYAYDATNLANELWDSTMVSGDAAGHAVKFTVPTVANGKVYVGTRGNNTGSGFAGSPNVPGQLDVYGLVTK